MRLATAVVALGLLAAACGGSAAETADGIVIAPGTTLDIPLPPQPPAAGEPLEGLELTVVATGLENVTAIAAPRGDERVFVVEQEGRVRVIKDGELLDEPFLDVAPFVTTEGLEQGLLGLAFHPWFADNGKFYVSYTNRNGDSRVEQYVASDGADVADVAAGVEVLAIDQPHEYHNGGGLEFGPDGYFYVSLGDGGGVGDTYGNGQRADTLLGAVLRIDVNAAEPYAIPPDNPFVEEGGAPEVWAYGLRNPWRVAVDPVERTVYIADVGQADTEEVDIVGLEESGLNFGWPVVEAEDCFESDDKGGNTGAITDCDDSGFTPPMVTYSHRDGCAVIGGPVYRGQAIPELYGHFVYADWCRGWVRSLRYGEGVVTDETDWSDDIGDVGRIVAVGSDGFGELYVGTDAGIVYRIDPVR
jgi:glucose/arabinose dehydrogenase